MQFQSIALILAGLMANGLMASPFPAPEPDYLVPTHAETFANGGSLVYYGLPNGTQARRSEDDHDDLAKRWWNSPSKKCNVDVEPTCDDDHGAANALCENLVDALWGYSEIAIGKNDGKICYKAETGGKECCIAWTSHISGLKKQDLAPYAQSIFTECTTNGISGKFGKINLKDKCVSICMSDSDRCTYKG